MVEGDNRSNSEVAASVAVNEPEDEVATVVVVQIVIVGAEVGPMEQRNCCIGSDPDKFGNLVDTPGCWGKHVDTLDC